MHELSVTRNIGVIVSEHAGSQRVMWVCRSQDVTMRAAVH